MTRNCIGCGAQFDAFHEYCSTCRIEASNKGEKLPSSFESNVGGLAFVGAAVFLILKWIFEFIWDNIWWFTGIIFLPILAFYIYTKLKTKSKDLY